MSEEAEARAAALLGELRAAVPAHREDLAQTVARRARWQREVRQVLVAVGAAASGAAGGLGAFVRGHRR
jgi:hypothetical protein